MTVRCPFEVTTVAGKTRRRPRVARYSRDYVVIEEGADDCAVSVSAWDDLMAAQADPELVFL